MAVEDEIQFERDGHVARVWLNRPWKKNCVTVPILDRLDEIITEVDEDPELRVLVFRGRGGTFCSGFDLDSLKADFVGKSNAIDVAVKSAKVCDRLYSMKTPSVAVLEGYVTMRRLRDHDLLRLRDRGGRRQDRRLPHPSRAVRRSGPIYRVPRMIGIRKTKELMLTGKLLSGVEATEFGLINDHAPTEQLDEKVEEFISHLTDKSPFTMWLTKMTIDRSLDADTQSLMVMEHLAVGVALNSEDAAEGVSAFLEKRDPKWQGR